MLALVQAGNLRNTYCISDRNYSQDPYLFTIFYPLIEGTRHPVAMTDYAQNKTEFNQYFKSTLGWFVLFCILAFFALVLIISSISCVSCPKCCRTCKKDLKRSDYQKSDKVRPYILFIFCSLCALTLSGYGIYIITQVYQYYYQGRCMAAGFAEDMNNETTYGFVGFSNTLSNKLLLLSIIYTLADSLNQTRYIDTNQTWIKSYYDYQNQLVYNMSKNYTNIPISNFNGGYSVLTAFQSGYFGPYNQANTVLNVINHEYEEKTGYRLEQLNYIYNDSINLYNDTFKNNITKALQNVGSVKSSSQYLYRQIPYILDTSHPYAFASLLILFIAFIFMSTGILLANLSFGCVISTQDRKFKYLSNTGWFTSTFSILMIFTVCLALSFGSGVLLDFCKIQSTMSNQQTVQTYTNLFNPQLAIQLHECIYGQHRNLKYSFGINYQFDTINSLNNHAIQYLNIKVKNNINYTQNYYLQLQTYLQAPATTLKFVQNQSDLIQPTSQISLVNIVSNINYPNASNPCDNAQDLYVEYNCSAYSSQGYIVLNTKNASTTGKSLKTCIDMTKFNYDYINQRYTSSSTSCSTLRTRYTQYRSFYEQLASSSGIIPTLQYNIADLLQQETDSYKLLASIKTNVDNLYKKLTEADKDLLFSQIDRYFDCCKNQYINENIAMLNTSYSSFINPVCNGFVPGIIELLSVCVIIGIFNLLNAIFGVCFVIRNKIDVPRYKNDKLIEQKLSYRSNSTSSEKSNKKKDKEKKKKQKKKDKGDKSKKVRYQSDIEETQNHSTTNLENSINNSGLLKEYKLDPTINA